MYSSSSFFVQTRLRTRSSSFLVQVAPQRVPGHPEAKSGQNLIRNGLLEAILEASRPASKPASQAQPLGRVFSTKRARGQDRRVFSSRLAPNGPRSPAARRPKVTKSQLEMASWRPFWRPAGQQASQQARLRRLVEFFRRNVSEDKIIEFSRVHGSDRQVFSRVCRIV